MYFLHREVMYQSYNEAKQILLDSPDILERLEKHCFKFIENIINENKDELRTDYNEANYLHPFWNNYPPLNRGKMPVGDQIPWIEVGEKAIGSKLTRLVSHMPKYQVREIGLPTGPDERYLLTSSLFYDISEGLTNSVMIFLDIKSGGPRESEHDLVVSPNQVSGNGEWSSVKSGVENKQHDFKGPKTTATQVFLPTIPPLYILSDRTIAPVIHLFVKPIYKMRSLTGEGHGQSLLKIKLVSTPNGILLFSNPGYANTEECKHLFRPGKDDVSKSLLQKRARIDLRVLDSLGDRITVINMEE